MKKIIENIQKDPVLVVWTWTSKIWQSVANLLIDNFDVIKTSKDAADFTKLDILNIQSIEDFIKHYLEIYGTKPLKAIFLNSWVMNAGDTINRFNFYRRSNNWDSDINTHLYNVVLLERLQMVWIVKTETKVIYNSSVQIVDGKPWFEDYAHMKSLVSNLLLNDDRWNTTVLCASLVEWTTMVEKFKNKLNQNWADWFQNFVKKNMPYWQPSLADIDNVVEQILLHKEETKWKFVFVDGWSVKNNKPESIDEDFLFYDKKANCLVPYKDLL